MTCPACGSARIDICQLLGHIYPIVKKMDIEPIIIEFRGYCSKKNRKAPNRNGRGLHMEPETRLMIQRMEMQVPGHVRDLHLEDPEVEWHFTYTNARVDKDGIITTVLDILQKYGVIVNDNIRRFNGKQTIWPAERGEEDIVKVVLFPRVVEPTFQRYVRPNRRVHFRPPDTPRLPEPEPTDEDFEEIRWDI